MIDSCLVRWRCRACGATGTVPLITYFTRQERFAALLRLTLAAHECNILNMFVDFPSYYNGMELES